MSSARTIREAIKALQAHFASARPPLSLPTETRRMLQNFVDEHQDDIGEEAADRAVQELRSLWDKYVRDSPQKLGVFVGALRELRYAVAASGETSVWTWYERVARPLISGSGLRKATLEDTQEFLVGVMLYEDDDTDTPERVRSSHRLCADLLSIYMARTRSLGDDSDSLASENAAVAQQVETVLVIFGRKHPKQLVLILDDYLLQPATRLQALTLLSAFLRHQSPRLYQLAQTSLVAHLLKCLMNDTSTTILSVALTSLIMLLPHIPTSLNTNVPRLFLIYSRLLCWEKFSPLSTENQRNLVTDGRVTTGYGSGRDHGDVGIDPTWQKARPAEGFIEIGTPELLTYFTYLYGLFPLNLMSYIRKPRKYLKQAEFPGADDFDLDQAVIRSRSEQFRQVHLLHPNFYNMTIEEELLDPKWPKLDPSDVVAEMHGLCTNTAPALLSPGPPPTGKLPELPPVPPIPADRALISPSASHTSLHSGHSWRDNQSTVVSTSGAEPESPVLGPRDGSSDEDDERVRPRSKASVQTAQTSPTVEDFPIPLAVTRRIDGSDSSQTNVSYLQRENTLLRNNLNFERWHKAQYSQHIGHLVRKNVKDATIEAETLNLINANRALKQQLESVRAAREATLKDSALTRKQANSIEANAADKLQKMRKDQESWATDVDELNRLRGEMKQYRDLLSEAEARELNKTHQLEMIKRDLVQMQKLQTTLQEVQRKLRDYEFREFDFERATRELEIVQGEKEVLQMRFQRQEADRERTRKMYSEKIAELEAQSGPLASPRSALGSPELSAVSQRALEDAQARLNQLKKAHSRLLEKYTDLELEYQSVKSQLEAMRGNMDSRSLYFGDDQSIASRAESRPVSLIYPQRPENVHGAFGVLESAYDMSEYGPSDMAITHVSNSDPTSRRYQAPMLNGPASPASSEATVHGKAGLTWRQAARGDENASYSGSDRARAAVYNKTAPLGIDERSMISAESGGGGGGGGASGNSSSEAKKGEKIKPNSEVRVYGRGGAQNIKMKSKDPTSSKSSDKHKSGGFGAQLKRLV